MFPDVRVIIEKIHRFGTVLAFVVTFSDVAIAASDILPETVTVPAGDFVMGSDRAERDIAYQLDEAAYGHAVTWQQRWYENELQRHAQETGAFAITRTPITNAQYANFLVDVGYPWPSVDRETWDAYGLIHPYERTLRHSWTGATPPVGRADHPVVMVSHADAHAFAAWLSKKSGRIWRLPSEVEWEKAVRGADGRYFPWGDTFDPARLNSHDLGPFDTVAVGQYPNGAGPFGLFDGAGQVYEWTDTKRGEGRYIVKGGSWDDKGCGVCRPAARHSRPEDIKHILIGFRLVTDIDETLGE